MSSLSLPWRPLGVETETREADSHGASGRLPVLALLKGSLKSVWISNVVACILVDCVTEIQNFENWSWDCSLWPMEIHSERFPQ